MKITKKKAVTVSAQKITMKQDPYVCFELKENMDKGTTILTPWQIELLEKRKGILISLDSMKKDLERVTNAVTDGNILNIKDTPQGTQLIKLLNGRKLIIAHYC